MLSTYVYPMSCFERITQEENQTWPKPRSGHRMCADDNFLYVFGGYNPSHKDNTFNELWQFNTSTNVWVLLPDVKRLAPTASASSSMVLVKNSIFVFGGTGYPFAKSNSNKLHMYSLNAKRWYDVSEITNFNKKYPFNFTKQKPCGCSKMFDSKPLSKYGQAMVAVNNNKLFIHAGTEGEEFTNELHSFCLKTFRWKQYNFCYEHGHQEPVARYRHEIVSLNWKLYVLGGATLKTFFHFSPLKTYDFTKNKWEQIRYPVCNEIPSGRKAHACILYKRQAYIVGGLNQNGPLQDFWYLDFDKLTWHEDKNKMFPYPVQFHSSTITSNGCMYIFGGVTKAMLRVSDLHQLWLDVPPLKRLAWLNVVKTLQHCGNFTRSILMDLKLPKHYWNYVDEFGDAAAA